MNPNTVPFPAPQACHACTHKYVGSRCPICAEERPAFTALKNLTRRQPVGAQPMRDPSACRYFPNALCGCEQRGLCLDAA